MTNCLEALRTSDFLQPLDTMSSPISWVLSVPDGADNPRRGGAGGIRTLDRALQPYNGLANRRLQPLGHSSMSADMPDARASRKRQIQITPKPFRAPALLLRSSRAAHIRYRALKRNFRALEFREQAGQAPWPRRRGETQTSRSRCGSLHGSRGNRAKLIRDRRRVDSTPQVGVPGRRAAAACSAALYKGGGGRPKTAGFWHLSPAFAPVGRRSTTGRGSWLPAARDEPRLLTL
jgi:hypothetical protein